MAKKTCKVEFRLTGKLLDYCHPSNRKFDDPLLQGRCLWWLTRATKDIVKGHCANARIALAAARAAAVAENRARHAMYVRAGRER